MQAFAQSGYWQRLALHLLDDRKLTEFEDGIEDQASKFMAGWLLARQGNLPDVLMRWREAGRRLARSRGMTLPTFNPKGPGRTVAKKALCPCGSGRTARRCHPAGLPH
jgi:SEC-C motif